MTLRRGLSSSFLLVTLHRFNVFRQVKEINPFFSAIPLPPSRAGVRPLTFLEWDLEVESLKKAKA